MAFGDFNGDGKVDIAIAQLRRARPRRPVDAAARLDRRPLRQRRRDVPGPHPVHPVHLPGGLAVGDFNGDGLPDLAVTQNYTGHAVGVMLNQPNTAQHPPTVTGVSPASGPTTGGTR